MGVLHPDHLLEQLTASQWAEWDEFNTIEPIGEVRADYRAGQIAAAIANYAGKTLKQGIIMQAGDFMPSLMEYKQKIQSGPVLLSDPVDQANLMRAVLFNKKE